MSQSDVWSHSVHGLFGVAAKCYAYTPLGKRSVGFGQAVNIRVKASVTAFVSVHNDQAFIPSMAREYGSDFSLVFPPPLGQAKFAMFEVGRINMTELNSDRHPCVIEENTQWEILTILGS